ERAEEVLDGGAFAADLDTAQVAVDEEVVEALGVRLDDRVGLVERAGLRVAVQERCLLVADAEREASRALGRRVADHSERALQPARMEVLLLRRGQRARAPPPHPEADGLTRA